MPFYWLVLGILGVWQMTHLLHAEEGPWGALRRLRGLLGALGLGNAVACFYCLCAWVALPTAAWLGQSWPERILLWFAIAGAASLVERTQRAAPPPTYFEDPPDFPPASRASGTREGDDHVQLREQEPAISGVPLRTGRVEGGNERPDIAGRDVGG